jgi:hypothetical protein
LAVGTTPRRKPNARGTEYGGLVEQAVYTICNVGIAELETPNLAMNYEADEQDPFPRGSMTMRLPNDDQIIVGIDAVDELVVQYMTDGNIIYSRTGMIEPRLGEVIGCIAAVIIRVNEMSAATSSKRKAA